MQRALEQARAGAHAVAAEVPVGAVLIAGGRLIAESPNRIRTDTDPTAHAELVVLRAAAARLGAARLTDATLYVTLEPCAMCAGAMVLARIRRLVYAAADPKTGMCGSLASIVQDPRLNHRLDVTRGVLAEASADLLRAFFRARRRGAGSAGASDPSEPPPAVGADAGGAASDPTEPTSSDADVTPGPATDARSRRSPLLEGVHEAALYAHDLPASERFWRRLGLRVIGRAEGRHVFLRAGRDLVLVFDPRATSRAGGTVPPHGAEGPGHVALSVPDVAALEAWRQRLARAAVPIEAETEWPTGGRSLYFRDPAGNSIELITRGSWGF
jgi:tRNA(adenine34) deaminase